MWTGLRVLLKDLLLAEMILVRASSIVRHWGFIKRWVRHALFLKTLEYRREDINNDEGYHLPSSHWIPGSNSHHNFKNAYKIHVMTFTLRVRKACLSELKQLSGGTYLASGKSDDKVHSAQLHLNQQNDKQLTKAQHDSYYYSGIFKAPWACGWEWERLASIAIFRLEVYPILVVLEYTVECY